MPEISDRRKVKEGKSLTYQNICESSVIGTTPAWYLEDSKYPPRTANDLLVYCSGKGVFGDIAESILNAKKSVDIVCTFFDPAMLLVRDDKNYQIRDHKGEGWKEGDPYNSFWQEKDSFGGIIIKALDKNPNLKIRLVIWLHATGQLAMPNIIGINNCKLERQIPQEERATGFDPRDLQATGSNKEELTKKEEAAAFNSLNLRHRSAEAAAYSRRWFQRVTWETDGPKTGRHKLFDRLTIVRRAITTPWFITQEDPRFGMEKRLLEFGCDHQKTVLIDLDDAESKTSKPHGYVLGHNYFTEYWSEFPFKHRDPANEMDYAPYHDFSMRVEGPILIDLNENFCEAWGINRKGILNTSNRVDHPLTAWGDRSFPDKENRDKYTYGENSSGRSGQTTYKRPRRELEKEKAKDLLRHRTDNIYPLLAALKPGKANAQVVRTRPDQNLHGAHEKEIKDAYLQVVRNATNYILLVNQYFQYNKLARQIKHWKAAADDAFAKACTTQPPRKLYLFLGTCKSERAGMVFRTQQMANEFGMGDQFETAFEEMYDKDNVDEEGHHALTKTGDNLDAEPHITRDELEKEAGIKPLFFMFYTQIPEEAKRKAPADSVAQQVYVHSKLMLEDDVFFTVGSANTNIRSMAVDSEINIISEHKETSQKVRHELMTHYVGKIDKTKREEFPNPEGESLTQAELEKVYELMEKRIEYNYDAVMVSKKAINGLIVKFHDDRSADVVRLA